MSAALQKRKRTAGPLRSVKKPKRFRKQAGYHSSSESDEDDEATDAPDFAPVNMDDSDEEIKESVPTKPQAKHPPRKAGEVPSKEAESDDEDEVDEVDIEDAEADTTDATSHSSASDSESDAHSNTTGKKRKRNDPAAFATSMSKILTSKLTTSKRADPVLSRSATAAEANRSITDSRLEHKARQKLKAEKKAALDRDRVKDVLGLETPGISAAEVAEREKRLKKTAQRGVVKLFNAVRAAQVQGERAREEAERGGVVGIGRREERVGEMSKKGFLDLIAKGGRKGATIEEG